MLGFCIQRSERQARFARARYPGKHDQRVAGNVDVDVLEIMLAVLRTWTKPDLRCVCRGSDFLAISRVGKSRAYARHFAIGLVSLEEIAGGNSCDGFAGRGAHYWLSKALHRAGRRHAHQG